MWKESGNNGEQGTIKDKKSFLYLLVVFQKEAHQIGNYIKKQS